MRVEARQLSHTFHLMNGSPLPALERTELDIQPGEFVVVIGPSGCGKSTLLRILAGLTNPTHGKALLDGSPPQQALKSKQIGWMAQSPALLPWRTVLSNISLAARINPQNGRGAMQAEELLEMVALQEFANAYPFQLSGGMQHRVALARTLALGARLWLMDEPFAALDELTRETLTRDVQALWLKLRPTVVWVTHHIYEALRLADRVMVMSARPGSVLAEVQVSLPHPRRESQPEFQHLLAQVRRELKNAVAQEVIL